MKGEKAQGKLFAVVLLILLVMAIFVIVWNTVKNTVKGAAEKVDVNPLLTGLNIKAGIYITGGAKIMIKRLSGEGEITELRFIFEKSDGETIVIRRKKWEYEMPGELETKIYYFNASEIHNKIEKVSVVPMFGKNAGVEVYGEVLKNEIDSGSGLISWWKFDGNAYDETGTNPGNLVGNAAAINDPTRRQVLSLDGNGDYVLLQQDSFDSLPNTITYSFWVKGDYNNSINTVIGYGDSSSTNYYLDVSLLNQSDYISVRYYARLLSSFNDCYYIGSIPLNSSSWNHVILITDSTRVIAYINDVTETLILQPGSECSNVYGFQDIDYYAENPTIGGILRSSFGTPFRGSIDDVMIFNKSLTAEEVKAVYNNQN